MRRLRVLTFLFLLVLGLACTSLFVNAEQTKKDVEFKYSYYANEELQDEITVPAKYGDLISVDNNASIPENHEFAYWLYNNVVKDVPLNHQFRITENTKLIAVLTPTDKNVVIFKDSNGQMLDIQFIANGNDAQDLADKPTKPGYVFASWDKSLKNITENTIITAQYSINETSTYNLTVYNGTTTKTEYNFNEIATVTATPERAGMYFSHWQVGNKIVSNQLTYSFTMLQDVTITAVYTEEDNYENAPLITLSDKIELRTGMSSFIGQYYLPSGYTLVEKGILISSTEDVVLTLDSEETYQRKESFAKLDSTNEFLMTFNASDALSVRAYMVYEDTEGNLYTAYDEEIESETLATDLFISEYIEGSGYNKAIEIYNGTGKNINLEGYKLIMYTDGSKDTSKVKVLNLTGTINNGDVLVISRSDANSSIVDVTDIFNSTVINFNGNDTIELVKGDEVIDVIGTFGSNDFAADVTLVRKSIITSGNTAFDINEWTSYSKDTFTYLGSHTMEGGATPIIILPSDITISGPTTVMAKETIELTATVNPEFASQNVIWSSSDESIATVDDKGVVTGISAGEVEIIATSEVDSNISKSYIITVTPAIYHSINLIFDDTKGNVTSDPVNQVLDGGNVTITVTPETGYIVSKVIINDEEVTIDPLNTYTFNNVKDNIKFEVEFEEKSGASEEVIYSTGFESSEGFKSSTVYNNKTPKLDGPTGQQWSFLSGTPATPGITGSQAAQMRIYDSNDWLCGNITTNFKLKDVTKVVFKAQNTSTINVKVSYSLDGENFIELQTINLTSTAKEYTVNVNVTGEIYLRFELVYETQPSDKARLIIDDVIVYGIR